MHRDRSKVGAGGALDPATMAPGKAGRSSPFDPFLDARPGTSAQQSRSRAMF